MRKLTIVFALGVVLLNCTNTYSITTATVEIEAMIDGRDWLTISGDSLQWHHFDYAAVGRHWGSNEPTIITTTFDNVGKLNQEKWFPVWEQDPPAEIRYNTTSSVFTGLFPGIPITGMVITDAELIPIDIRWAAKLKEFTNDSVVVEFNDDPLASHYWYKARINIEMIPEPATMFLFGLGGLALRKRRH